MLLFARQQLVSSNLARMFFSVAGRVLVGYVLFRMFALWRVEAAELSGYNTVGAEDTNFPACDYKSIEQFVAKTSLDKKQIQAAYENCRDEFVASNQISPIVKQTVDSWIGTDLSRAEDNQMFLIYQLVLNSRVPKIEDANFATDCNKMFDQFENFRDYTDPLAEQIDIDLNTLLMGGNEQIDEQDRQLLTFIQYTRFCKYIIEV